MSFVLQSVSKAVSALSGNKGNYKEIHRNLLTACKNGDIDSVNECLSMRNDLNVNWEECISGFTPLKYAVYYGHYEIVSILLKQKGIDTGVCGGEYYESRNYLDFEAPIYLAVQQAYKDNDKYLKIIKLLYKYGANINIETKQYMNTPFLSSIKFECVPIFKYFINKSELFINKMNGNKWNALHFAAFYNKKEIEIISTLLEYGVSVNQQNCDGSTPLHLAIRSWPIIQQNDIQKQKIKLLIKYGANINKIDRYKKTPFDYCCDKNKAIFMEYTKKYGFDKNNLIKSYDDGLNEDEKEIMKILYPTPNSNEVQQQLLKENEKLKTEVVKLQQKFDLLANDNNNNNKIEKKEEDTNNGDELWQKEDEYKQFVEWLTKKVKLSRYLKNFEDDGWSDIRLIPDINKSELENLGIKLSGHQRIILKEVEKYKQKLEMERNAEGAQATD